MSHVHEARQLTFGDLKEIVERARDGRLDQDSAVVEKVDGQNLLVSWKDGEAVAARNKGNLKGYGENSLTLQDLNQKFEGRGSVRDAFVLAFEDISKKLGSMKKSLRNRVFENGRRFMNLEIVWPENANVIPYKKPRVIFHGLMTVSEDGTVSEFDVASAHMLSELVTEDEHFTFQGPNVVQLGQISNDQADVLVSMIERLQGTFSDEQPISKWHDKSWAEEVKRLAEIVGYDVPENVVEGFVRRWSWKNKSGDMGYSVRDMKKDVDHQEFLALARAYDKKLWKRRDRLNDMKFERVFSLLSTMLFERSSGFLIEDMESASRVVENRLETEVDSLETNEKLEREISRVKAAGNKVFATEGVVVTYRDHKLKLVGSFAPVNQIMGMARYNR